MPDLRWPPFENMTQFLRHVTSSAYVADFKGNIFDYLPSKGGAFWGTILEWEYLEWVFATLFSFRNL